MKLVPNIINNVLYSINDVMNIINDVLYSINGVLDSKRCEEIRSLKIKILSRSNTRK